eukprot:15175303-Alexandrium_andersonii.AAC.1
MPQGARGAPKWGRSARARLAPVATSDRGATRPPSFKTSKARAALRTGARAAAAHGQWTRQGTQ